MFIDVSLPLFQVQVNSQSIDERSRSLMSLGHVGTHLDRLLKTTIPLEYCKCRALVFDVSAFVGAREVGVADINVEMIAVGDFIVFHTGHSKTYGYATPEYLSVQNSLSWELITILLEKKIRFIGIDARAIRLNAEHAQADALCEEQKAYVIENLCNVDELPYEKPFTMYVAWFDTGGTGLPCRLVAEV